MAKVVLTAQVEDTASWEKAFRTHRDLFRSFGLTQVYEYGIGENSEVAVVVDVSDADAFLKTLESPENVDAMKNDGVIRDTVKVFVIDRDLPL
ncbi:MAG: hypothetical protein PVG24_14965 [Gammaproteobacteria bacterium]|jgi:hypothetical protein